MEKEEEKKINIYPILFFSILIYFLYLEINPKIRGIWLRKGDDNRLNITLNGLKNFILYPFKNIKMWLPNMWDMNVFVAIPIISSLGYLLTEYYKK